jgi:nucleoside-diphosphate-sugar epimerase
MGRENILVIGAGGQLGSELTQRLRDIHGKDSVTATDVNPPKNLLDTDGKFEILDVLNYAALSEFIQKNDFTQVYHLAAVLSATGEKNPAFAWKLNMDGLLYVLQLAVQFKIKKVYWPSSIAVFGPDTPKVNTPQQCIMEPSTVYGISKLAGERWCDWYHSKHGLDVRSLRYPGLIGYKALPGGGTTDYAVDIFFKALTEKSYQCFLKPDTFLPMMYMEDALDATIRLMEAPPEKITIRSSYNLGAISFSPADIAAAITSIIPEFHILYKPDFRQQIADSWPNSIDDSIAIRDWGHKPKFDLELMVKDMLKNIPRFHKLEVIH